MQLLTMPSGSPAQAAFIMDGDHMRPFIRRGQVVTVVFALPAIGECGLFQYKGRTLVRQYCEDSFKNAYLLVLDRTQAALDVTVPAGDELICLGRLQLEKTPPLPLL